MWIKKKKIQNLESRQLNGVGRNEQILIFNEIEKKGIKKTQTIYNFSFIIFLTLYFICSLIECGKKSNFTHLISGAQNKQMYQS